MAIHRTRRMLREARGEFEAASEEVRIRTAKVVGSHREALRGIAIPDPAAGQISGCFAAQVLAPLLLAVRRQEAASARIVELEALLEL